MINGKSISAKHSFSLEFKVTRRCMQGDNGTCTNSLFPTNAPREFTLKRRGNDRGVFVHVVCL